MILSKAEPVFHCRVGDHVRPEAELRIFNGHPVCEEHWDGVTRAEQEEMLARDIASAADEDFTRKWPALPFARPLLGAPSITRFVNAAGTIYFRPPINVSNGVATGFRAEGLNLEAAQFTLPAEMGTVTTVTDTPTLVRFSFTPAGTLGASYSLAHAGFTYRNFFKVV